MSLVIATPAALSDATALAFPSGRAPGWQLRAMILQCAVSETIAFHDGEGRAVMIVGLWPLAPEREGERLFELWLLIAPGAVPHLPALRRLALLTLRRVAESGAVRIRALVRVGHRPGERLAALVGLARCEVVDGFTRFERQG